MTGMTNVTKLASEPSGQEFLVFTLGDEEYGIDILKVQEIRGYDQVTRIANTPAFIKGVTNLRGVIVPIVDLRIKFSQVDVDYNDNTVVIVLNLGQRVVGIVVDGGANSSGTGICRDAFNRISHWTGRTGRPDVDSGEHRKTAEQRRDGAVR